MNRRSLAAPLAVCLTAVPALVLAAGPARAADPTVTVKALKLDVTVPAESANDTGPRTCTIDADLYTPSTATKATPAPAILATNGFGGSKADQAGLGQAFAKKGYIVLSYSGLGFGSDPLKPGSGSTCKITLDDREHDGAAGKQLIDYLGGTKKANDGTTLDNVKLDKPGDPRVGMVGGSYGGEVQFAVAAVDPRLDTIVPLITWNDLAYSLAPNNTSLPSSTSVTYRTPGTEKVDWTTLFFGLGFVDGLEGATATSDPTRVAPCTNFTDQACKSKAFMDATGYPDQATLDFARNASVESYIMDIKIPTLLGQGQADTLFNLREAAATYASLKSQGTPVKMIWQQWGHSHAPLPGEFDLARPDTNYEGQVVTAWFDHYLKDSVSAPTLDFSYFRDWVPYRGNAAPAFTSAPSYPLPGTTTLYLSGDKALTPNRGAVSSDTETFAVPAGGAPFSYTETSALDQSGPVTDTPGTFTAFATPPLSRAVDVVGIPTATLHLASPTASATQASGPAGQLVAFVKLYDVAADGSAVVLPHRVISPIRISDVSKPVEVSLPGVVHRFPKGHRMQLVVSLSDAAYKNNLGAQIAQLSTSKAAPSTLVLPGRLQLGAAGSSAGTTRPSDTSGGSTGATASTRTTAADATSRSLASTGLPPALPAIALVLVSGSVALVRRRSAASAP